MKLNVRLANTIAIVSAFNIIILTLLMHLKFHITNMNLLQDSISVATYSFVKNIKDSTESGIPLESISYIPTKIEYIINKNSIINNIFVFSVIDNNLTEISLKDKGQISDDTKKELMKSINSSKSVTWRYDGGDEISFIGNTVRDNVGNDRAAVIVTYSKKSIANKGDEEIYNLYKRMLLALIICISISFIIGFYYIHPIEKLIANTKKILQKLKQNKEFSIEEIADLQAKEYLENIIDDIKNTDKQLRTLEAETTGQKK